MRIAITLWLVLLALPMEDELRCQQPHSVARGDHVRVYRNVVGGHPWDRRGPDAIGTILTLSADSLVLLGDDGIPLVLPFEGIRSLEVNRGPHSNWLKGMAAGAVFGAGAGLVTGLLVSFETQGCQTGIPLELSAECQDWTLSALGAVGLGALAGALVGATVGSFIKTDKWEGVSLDQGAVKIIARRGQIGVVASIVF